MRAAEVVLPCIADTSICCHPSEVTHNLGAAGRTKIKGTENYLLLDFDVAGIRGRGIAAATLYLTSAIPNPMLRKVGVSTVATPWAEGTRQSQDVARDGDSTFLSPEQGRRDWAGPGSDFTYASFGVGGTFWRRAYLDPPAAGVFAIPVEPRLVECLAAGLSSGLAVSDDNGEVMYIAKEVCPDTCHDNNFLYSRESPGKGPRLVVTLAPETSHPAAPAPVRELLTEAWPAAATDRQGALRVRWNVTADEAAAVLGYAVSSALADGAPTEVPRWRVPLPPAMGGSVAMVLDGLPPGAPVTVVVTAVGRGGLRSGAMRASGQASAAARVVSALPLPEEEAVAGAEPEVRAGALRVWAFPDLLKVNPITGNLLEEPGVAYGGPAAGQYRRANPVWDGARGRISVRGARGEWVAFQLVVDAAGDAAAALSEIRVGLPDALRGTGPAGGNLTLQHAGVSRAWYIRCGEAWYADPLVPVTAPVAVPWAENAVPGQRNQTLYLEFFIPAEAQPGDYEGGVAVAARGVPEFQLPLDLTVYPVTVPVEAHFVWSMNAYSSPGEARGRPGEPRYLAAERDFYVQSHRHRTCLAILHYSHAGIIGDAAAPPLTGAGAAMRVADWGAFDARFGPLFDGSAFAGTPRAGLPLDHFYLTFHENWPVPMADGYAWNAERFENHWRVCGPVAEGFSSQYQDAWKAVLADFAGHFRDRGWTQTRMQIYLNNKFFYKRYDEKTQRYGRGTSFWLLDEPAYADDFLALGFFGRLCREAIGDRRTPFVFRGDISRPQFQRDSLDGLLDVNVCGNYAAYRPMVDGRRERFGEVLWTYGSLCAVDASAMELAVRALWLYGHTVDGFVPWLTLGGVKAWTEPTETIAFYPGTPVGVQGSVPSLRLKACRRGEQDIEYAWLLAQKQGLDRRQVGALVLDTLDPAVDTKALDSHGARFETPRVPGTRLERFRAALAAALSRER